MAPHSSTLAWKIPRTEEPGGLQSMGSLGVGQDWATALSLFTFHFYALEKEMATHSSVLAWRIPGTVEPGGLPSMGSHRVGHDWSNLAAAAAAKGSQVKISAPKTDASCTRTFDELDIYSGSSHNLLLRFNHFLQQLPEVKESTLLTFTSFYKE